MGDAGARGPIELTFTYTEDEYLSAARLFPSGGRDPGFERALRVAFVALTGLVLALAGDPYLGGILAAFLLAGLAAGHYAGSVRPRRAFRRDPKFRDPYAVSFAEEGVGLRSKDFEARFRWDYYSKVVETPDFFFFVYAEEMYFLVPKRALRRDRGDDVALGELLRRKFGARMEARGLPEAEARGAERGYVPPPEPPDWR